MLSIICAPPPIFMRNVQPQLEWGSVAHQYCIVREVSRHEAWWNSLSERPHKIMSGAGRNIHGAVAWRHGQPNYSAAGSAGFMVTCGVMPFYSVCTWWLPVLLFSFLGAPSSAASLRPRSLEA